MRSDDHEAPEAPEDPEDPEDPERRGHLDPEAPGDLFSLDPSCSLSAQKLIRNNGCILFGDP